MSPFRLLLIRLGLPLLCLLTSRSLADAETVPPTVEAFFPESGFVFRLSQLEVHFSEAVQGVDAGDLRVNGLAATAVRPLSADVYVFTLPELPLGTSVVTWASDADIQDLADSPNRFAGAPPIEYHLLPPPRLSRRRWRRCYPPRRLRRLWRQHWRPQHPRQLQQP